MHDLFNFFLTAIGINTATRFGNSLLFFIADSVKVLLILFIAISAIGVLRTYVSKENIQKYLGGKHKFLSSFAAALFAIFTPFCSCSSIPIFLSLVKMRVPFASAICFLAVSPLVNEYLVVLMPNYYGLPIVIIYILGGIFLGMSVGWTLEKLGMEKYLEPEFIENEPVFQNFPTFKSRLIFGYNEGKTIVKRLWIWILLGVGVGAIIHGYVPDVYITKIVNAGGIFSVPLAALVGAPVYGSCAGVVPIALIFFGKPVALGTVLSFLMSVSAMSLPEAVILRGAMKLKLLLTFFGLVFLGIILMGYFINIIAPLVI